MRWGDRLVVTELDSTAMECVIEGIDMERYAAEANTFVDVLTSGPLRESTNGDALLLVNDDGRELQFMPAH